MTASETKVLQVTNISPSATLEQLETLFNFLGTIDEMQIFPKTNSTPVGSKVAFVRFQSTSPVATGQHLTNTVFIDRPLTCVAYNEGIIPTESVAMQYVAPLIPDGTDGVTDAHQIPGNVDPNKVEEIKRTIYVGNLDSKSATAEQLLQFFSTCGEVKFVRMAGDETQPTRFAFVEFGDQASVQNALQLNGMLFGDRPIKVNHSNNAIVKPQNKTQEAAAKEIEEAMRRVREAQSLISRALEPEVPEKRRRSRSRSRHRRSHRSRSRSRSRRRRRSRSRSYGRSKSRRSRSKSRSRRRRHRTRSRSRKRSAKRSRSRSKKKSSSPKKRKSRSKSRSKSPSKKSSRHKKDRKRDRESKKRRHRSRSKSRESESKRESKDKKENEEKRRAKSASKEKEIKVEKMDTDVTEQKTAVVTNGDSKQKNGDT